jgi:archaellum component FlaG (FlaF/FlaG flagellin family)
VPLRIDTLSTMKAFFVMMIVAGLVSSAAAQPLDTAENVAKKTAEKTKEAAHTVAHGVKKAANKVEDALTPDADARRVDVTVNDGEVNMSSDLEPGKTAFVVKNEGKTKTNFEVTGGDIDRKFIAPPGPGETKVLHVTLKRGAHYTVYSTNTDNGKRTKKMTLNVK